MTVRKKNKGIPKTRKAAEAQVQRATLKFIDEHAPDKMLSWLTVGISNAFAEINRGRNLAAALEDLAKREGYEALVRRDQAAYFDSMVDTLYFIYGTAVELGWDIDEAFARVHKANMDKLGSDGLARFRTDGKVIKPEGWTAPNLGDLVK